MFSRVCLNDSCAGSRLVLSLLFLVRLVLRSLLSLLRSSSEWAKAELISAVLEVLQLIVEIVQLVRSGVVGVSKVVISCTIALFNRNSYVATPPSNSMSFLMRVMCCLVAGVTRL